MKKTRFLTFFVTLFVALSFLFGTEISLARIREASVTDNDFEYYFVELLMQVGDFFTDKINDIVGEDVTITKLVYNEVGAVNPNFFDKDHNAGLAHVQIEKAVKQWYNFFRRIAISIYLITLLMIGLKALYNSTAEGLTQARSLLVEWFKGVMYLFFMPILLYFIMTVNDALVREICNSTGVTFQHVGSSFSDGSSWSSEAIEYRSPEFVSKYTGTASYGSSKNNDYYLKHVDSYAKNFDLIKIARAFVGVTYRLSYCMIWFICIGQLITFIYIYYKRYFMITFFIAIFPVICIFQAVGIMKDGKASAVSGWLGEFIGNVFIQAIHAVVYTIITAITIKLLLNSLNGVVSSTTGGQQSINSNAGVNWVIIVVAINFVPEGEKILKSILKKVTSGSAGGVGDGGLKKGFNALRGGMRQLMPHFGGGGASAPGGGGASAPK